MLGWDGADTPLKLDHLDKVLHARLRWPDDESDQKAWREHWGAPFRHRIGHVIRTADRLAEVLAGLARNIRDRAQTMLAAEADNGPLRVLHKAFKTALIHDLSEDSFADTYAQTITYGLLTAAISRTERSEGRHGTALIADNIADMVPVTNPFLKEMLQTFLHVGGRKGGIDFDELGIQDVVELLRGEETDLPAILRDFGNKTRGEDPVIHFYEHFLSAYNKKLKIQRGVFYTPQPVVYYIVRSVHELLQTEFGLEDGLAATVTWGEMAERFVIPAGMPESSHKDVKLAVNNAPKINTGVAGKLPSMALDSGNPCRNDAQPTPFKIPEGTSPDSPFVVILDPATGTATFLVEVINIIHKTLTEKWRKQGMKDKEREAAWNEYVPKHLLPRLYGYELMMAPYAIAHMKIGLKLHETGYQFGSEERARIYLTNALEPASDGKGQMEIEEWAPALAHEAKAVNAVKQGQRFTVVVGNPPYAGHSSNLTETLREIVEPYRFVNGEKIKEKGALQFEKSIQDDYVKFFRYSQRSVELSGVGILGLVTSHGFLDNPFLRGMRFSILSFFNSLLIVDLHGNVLRHEKRPDGSSDNNVFDIKQTGVAISIFIKHLNAHAQSVRRADIYGDRNTVKYPWLKTNTYHTTTGTSITSHKPFFLLIPEERELWDEYGKGYSIAEIMQVYSKGVVTGRDAFVIDFDKEPLLDRMLEFKELGKTDNELISKYDLNPTEWWQVDKARRDMPVATDFSKHLRTILYRPFDIRYCFYHPAIFMSPRRPVMQHVDPGMDNIILITSRMTKGESFSHVTLARGLAEAILLSSKTSNNAIIFPLYLYSGSNDLGSNMSFLLPREPNFSREFLASLKAKLGVALTDGYRGSKTDIGYNDILAYIVSILHSQSYRERYADFLTRDFPKVPLTGFLELFHELSKLGGELVSLHLLESPKLNQFITEFQGEGDNSIPKKPVYKDGAVWINASQRFQNVPEAVWLFHIGGYQVCEKWLKDRKGRRLSAEDIAHYQKVVVALSETIRLMQAIDETIDQHGGWPGAFTGPDDTTEGK